MKEVNRMNIAVAVGSATFFGSVAPFAAYGVASNGEGGFGSFALLSLPLALLMSLAVTGTAIPLRRRICQYSMLLRVFLSLVLYLTPFVTLSICLDAALGLGMLALPIIINLAAGVVCGAITLGVWRYPTAEHLTVTVMVVVFLSFLYGFVPTLILRGLNQG